ncbi:hypothetical protein PTKIN_Ptkin19aG0034300 [Pterospermum kingtungense]
MDLSPTHEALKVDGNWTDLWRLRIPPKVKNFPWRACRVTVLTRIKLSSRGISVPISCVLRNNDVETIWDILVDCPFANSCWKMMKCDALIANCSHGALLFADCFFKLLQTNSDLIPKIAMVFWNIWKSRNDYLWNDVVACSQRTVSTAISFLYEWTLVLSNLDVSPSSSTSNSVVRWLKPQVGYVKCSVDLIEMAFCILKKQTALLEAVYWVRHMGWSQVVFEIDCQEVVQSITKHVDSLPEYGSLVSQCLGVLDVEKGYQVIFVK